MSSIYGWWNLSKKKIPKEEWTHVNNVTAVSNSENVFDFLNEHIALGRYNTTLNSEDLDGIERCQLITKNNITIVADVRLDNRKELTNKLQLNNDKVSDTRLILEAYLQFGAKCVDHLIGAFAFIIWDNQAEKIFGARDHIGVKPFNYYFLDNIFLFGSQRKSILAVKHIDKSADWDFIVKRMNNRMYVKDSTSNLHVKKLLPAHTIEVTKDGITTQKYWELDIDSETVYSKDEEYVVRFLELFKQSISARMRGSAQVAAHLSGGLDSSGVASVAASLSKGLDKTFHSLSYTFPEGKKAPQGVFNFNKIVEDQIEHSDIKHAHFVTKLSKLSYLAHLNNEFRACDGMSWSNNVKTEYEILEVAKDNGVGINLSGFLGDEIITSFCRPYYLEYLAKGKYFKFFKSDHDGMPPHHLLGLLGLKFADKLRLPLNNESLAQTFQKTKNRKYHVSLKVGSLFNQDFIESNSVLKDALKEKPYISVHEKIPLSFKEYQRNHISRHWTSRRMEHEILAAQQFGTEYRYPMADIRLLQYVLSLPIEQKRNDEFSRLLYRRAMKDYLIDDIRLGKKYLSYLKPLAFYQKGKNDTSVFTFWNSVRDKSFAKFLDVSQINDLLRYNRELQKLKPYFILLRMMQEEQINIYN